MSMNEVVLFTYLRRAPFGGRLTQGQVDGVRRIVRICQQENVRDLRHVANILAQDFHETGARMQPVREAFASSDREAIRRIENAWRAGRMPWVRTPYWRDGWFGRGDIQITHKANYERMGGVLGVDLVRNRDLALDPEVSGRIVVIGMRDGLFTGKKLSDYFNAKKNDPVGARRIVNGTDKAKLIAQYHGNFYDALVAAAADKPAPKDVSYKAAEPDDMRPAESKSWWTTVTSYVGGVGFTGFSLSDQINNPFALTALAFLVVAGGVIAWLVLSGRLQFQKGQNDADLGIGSTPVVDAASGDSAAPGGDLSDVDSAVEPVAAWDTGLPVGGGSGARRAPVRKAKRSTRRRGGTAKAKRGSRAKAKGVGS